MPPLAPSNRKADDFDMVKLQKSLQQRRRHSRHHVAKLTPAEIRSLNNNNVATSHTTSRQSSTGPSVNSNHRTSNATPPATPDTHGQSAYQAQVSRSSSVNLPTPPHSPNLQHRRASHSSVQNAPRNPSHIHAPVPRSTTKPEFMNHTHSRPSSATSLLMYRGHEVTQTGSRNMLQRPAQEIVTNPLSMYSRPRQSLLNSSTEKQRRDDFQDLDMYQAQAMLNAYHEEETANLSGRGPLVPMMVDSPISLEVHHAETEQFPVMDSDPVMTEKQQPQVSNIANKYTSASPASEQSEDQPHLSGKSNRPANDHNGDAASAEPKKSKKRFSFTQVFEHKTKDSNVVKKRDRRRTVSFTKSTKDTDSTNGEKVSEHHEKDGLLTEHSSDSDGNIDFPSNPAVRPFSQEGPYGKSDKDGRRSMSLDDINSSIRTSGDDKAKGSHHHLAPISIPSRPVYGRCDCCGKLKRPNGYASGLSPVFENENLRTNFSFEADRSKGPTAIRSSGDRKRYTAIIPMEIREGDAETGSIRTVQASIAPYDPSVRSESRLSMSTTMSGAVGSDNRKKRRSESSSDSRVVRFASLHAKKGESPTGQVNDVDADEEDVIEESTPIVQNTGTPDRQSLIEVRQEHTPRPESQASIPRPESQASVPRPDSQALPVRPESQNLFRPEVSEEAKALTNGSSNRQSMPKQDVIDVVGWENGKRVDETGTPVAYSPPQPQPRTEELSGSPLKEDKRKSRVSEIFKILQPRPKSMAPNPSDENLEQKRGSVEEGINLLPMFKGGVAQGKQKRKSEAMSPQRQKPRSQQESPPLSQNQSKEEVQQLQPPSSTDSAIDEPSELPTSKFAQYDANEVSKSKHAPKLSLNLGADSGSGFMVPLPEPQMGVEFKRSSLTLRGLALPGEKTPDSDLSLTETEMSGANGGEAIVGAETVNGEQKEQLANGVAHDGEEIKKRVKTKSGQWYGIKDFTKLKKRMSVGVEGA